VNVIFIVALILDLVWKAQNNKCFKGFVVNPLEIRTKATKAYEEHIEVTRINTNSETEQV
jgi:hypothetical protein